MPKSKIDLCENKLAKANDSITKFMQEHKIDEIVLNRNIKLHKSERDEQLSSKITTLDMIKTAKKLYLKLNRLEKKEKLEQELYNLTLINETSPTFISTTFFH